MIETLLKVMPLYLASTMSPGILALAVILLSKKQNGLIQTLALLVGSLITSIIIIIVGLKLGQTIADPSGKNLIDNIIDLVLAILFLIFGIKSILYKDDDSKTKKLGHDESKKLLLWLGIGFVISITNFDAVIFDLTAAKETGQAIINNFDKFIILLLGVLFFNLPIILPLVLYSIAPKFAQKILTPLNVFLQKYGGYIVGAIFLGFAIYLGYEGLKGLI